MGSPRFLKQLNHSWKMSPPPGCVWAQRPKHIILTVCLTDCKDPVINVEKKKLHFKGVGGTEMKEHEVTMEFFKEIDPDKSKFAVRPREVSFVLESKLKQHWLKIDYKNWVDEDEEEEPGQGQDLEEMMRQMGGLGGAGAQAGGVGAAEMGDMTKKAYQRPTLDDLDIEEEEEDDMPDLE